MDLSKACNCLPHELLIAKSEAYGVNKGVLYLKENCWENQVQRTNIGSSHTSLHEGVSQDTILGPLSFNILINNIFAFNEKNQFCNSADCS